MFCSNCGIDVSDAKFCPQCGTGLVATAKRANTADIIDYKIYGDEM